MSLGSRDWEMWRVELLMVEEGREEGPVGRQSPPLKTGGHDTAGIALGLFVLLFFLYACHEKVLLFLPFSLWNESPSQTCSIHLCLCPWNAGCLYTSILQTDRPAIVLAAFETLRISSVTTSSGNSSGQFDLRWTCKSAGEQHRPSKPVVLRQGSRSYRLIYLDCAGQKIQKTPCQMIATQ